MPRCYFGKQIQWRHLKALRTWRNLNQQKISDLEALPIPPQPFNFPSTEAALNVAMYNSFLGCVVSIICFLIDDVTFQELEAFNPAYQNLPIAAELMERHDKCRESGDPYKTGDAVRMGISIFLFHGVRKCFSSAWQKWSVFALRSIGREGLSNGFTSVNTIEVIYQLEDMTRKRRLGGLNELRKTSSLGSMRNRLIPLLMPVAMMAISWSSTSDIDKQKVMVFRFSQERLGNRVSADLCRT